MKLRNKKTGEILEIVAYRSGDYRDKFNSLTELNAEWEEYEEPKHGGYIIDPTDEDYYSCDDEWFDVRVAQRAKELGMRFETEEEAQKAVEKLKAWKRLKDLGFSFDGAYLNKDSCLIKTKIDKAVSFNDAEQFYCDFETLFGEVHES